MFLCLAGLLWCAFYVIWPRVLEILTMNLEFLHKFPWFWAQKSNDLGPILKSSDAIGEQGHQNTRFDFRIWGFSLLSFLPWEDNANSRDIILAKTTINRNLKRQVKRGRRTANRDGDAPLRFKPYVCKVPWHTGVRAFFSQLFPRYGHYCGPNWSSGKDNGSLVWDKRPIDWLDFCCYCHDIGYDTHSQGELLKADMAFLECLERPNMATKGDAHIATLYRTMCISGTPELHLFGSSFVSVLILVCHISTHHVILKWLSSVMFKIIPKHVVNHSKSNFII